MDRDARLISEAYIKSRQLAEDITGISKGDLVKLPDNWVQDWVRPGMQIPNWTKNVHFGVVWGHEMNTDTSLPGNASVILVNDTDGRFLGQRANIPTKDLQLVAKAGKYEIKETNPRYPAMNSRHVVFPHLSRS